MSSIGTVLSHQGSVYMVIGYETFAVENRFVPHYIVVPIPLGYMEPASLRVIPIESVDTILQEGYVNELSEKYIKARSSLFEGMNRISPDRWEEEERTFLKSVEMLGDSANEE